MKQAPLQTEAIMVNSIISIYSMIDEESILRIKEEKREALYPLNNVIIAVYGEEYLVYLHMIAGKILEGIYRNFRINNNIA